MGLKHNLNYMFADSLRKFLAKIKMVEPLCETRDLRLRLIKILLVGIDINVK